MNIDEPDSKVGIYQDVQQAHWRAAKRSHMHGTASRGMVRV